MTKARTKSAVMLTLIGSFLFGSVHAAQPSRANWLCFLSQKTRLADISSKLSSFSIRNKEVANETRVQEDNDQNIDTKIHPDSLGPRD